MSRSAPTSQATNISRATGLLTTARTMLVALVATLALTACLDHDPEFSAVWETQKAIRQKLVSPGSAEFNRSACKVAATTKDGKYRIAYVEVDSQNKLGAKLRSYGFGLVMDKKDDAAVLAAEVYAQPPKKADLIKLTQGMGDAWQISDWAK